MAQLPLLDIIYTADEAAEKLKLTRRAVITNGKRYGLCFEAGRQVRFTETQLVRLVEAMQFKPVSSIGGRYVAAYNSGMAYARLRARAESEARAKAARKEERQARMATERERRRIEEAEERARKLEVKRQITRQREETKAAKQAEHLDITNRDPAYWTVERKELLRQEREARLAANKSKLQK